MRWNFIWSVSFLFKLEIILYRKYISLLLHELSNCKMGNTLIYPLFPSFILNMYTQNIAQ